MSERLSLRAFARRQGVALSAVQRAIADGRLAQAVGRDEQGRPCIVDAERAAAEWEANTRPRVAAGKAAAGRPAGAAEGSQAPADAAGAGSPLAAATLRERLARARAIELETAMKERELVPAREAEIRWTGYVVGCKTKLLGVPSRAKQRLPQLSVGDLAVLDELVREALEELADDQAPAGARA
jgi:phage terminase Nu1 subunit (DNA packaging protein)